MFSDLKKLFIGKPLATVELQHERFPTLFGLAILSSDAISSVAYASEEILWVLIPTIGIAAYGNLIGISAAIITLLAVLVFSYRQTIHAYPNGGGAYTVAKENLGISAGLIAGASLSVDYLLTVAVSTSAGTAAIVSAFPELAAHKIAISIGLIALIAVINLRGVRESAKTFSLPTYLFVISMIMMIITGLIKYKIYGSAAIPNTVVLPTEGIYLGWAYILLLLRAFSSGCSALTGLEAISNSVPNFKEPSPRNAIVALGLLALLVLLIFGGVSILATIYHAIPRESPTVLSQIASAVFSQGPLQFPIMYYIIQITTALILIMASNTAFNGFPMLMSVIAQDGYAPRQLNERGDRLSYSNGIVILAVVAAILIIIFRGDTHLLIPLYAVGVFLSFTLSQTGMTLKWIRGKEKGWVHKTLVNGIGAFVTAVAVIIIGATKFIHGAWIVILLIPFLVWIMLKIKKHYNIVADHLRIGVDELKQIDLEPKYDHEIIVPLASINKAVVQTLKYAKSLSSNVTAVHVAINEEAAQKWNQRWKEWNPGIPLVVINSPFRELLDPFIEYIDDIISNKDPEDRITVLIPQFIAVNEWESYFLHNQTSFFIREALLLKHKGVVVSNYPFYIDDVFDAEDKSMSESKQHGDSKKINKKTNTEFED